MSVYKKDKSGFTKLLTRRVATPPSLLPSRTKPEDAVGLSMSEQIARVFKSGLVSSRPGLAFQDVSGVQSVSYEDMLLRVRDADEAFIALPSKIRDRFGHDSSKLVAFIDDPENFDEAVRLGLLAQPAAPAADDSVKTDKKAPKGASVLKGSAESAADGV